MQQVQHLARARGRCGAPRHDLVPEPRHGVRREPVAILEIRTEALPLAAVRPFAPGLLVDVDVLIALRRKVAVHEVALVHPLAQCGIAEIGTARSSGESVYY